jgi:hypothetical protein
VFRNITTKHPAFTLMYAHHSNIMVALAPDFGLNLLARSTEVFVDETFETTESKLILTVVMALLDDVIIFSVFFLSNFRETDTYEVVFRVRFTFILFYSILFFYLILACLLISKCRLLINAQKELCN